MSSKKRVVYFEVTGKGTGSAVSLRAILDGLDRDKYEPVLWFGDYLQSNLWDNEQVYRIKTARLANYDFHPASWSLTWIKHFSVFLCRCVKDAFSVPLMLHRLRPSILHLNEGHGLTVGIYAKVMGIPVVWHIREAVCENWIGEIQDRIYAWAASRVITISDFVSSRVPYSSAQGKVVRLYNAVGEMPSYSDDDECGFVKKLGQPEVGLRVLLLGSIRRNKGYDFLAEVAALTKGQVLYVLAGGISSYPNEEQQFIIEKWAPLVAQGNAVFVGHVNARLAMQHVDLVVCPNRTTEPLGRTVLEAYRCGVPVIAVNRPAFNETVKDGDSGRLLELDSLEWANSLLELSQDPELLLRYKEGARRQSCYFDDEVYMKQVERIYGEVADDCK